MTLSKNRKKTSFALGLCGLAVLVAFGLSQQAGHPPVQKGTPKPFVNEEALYPNRVPFAVKTELNTTSPENGESFTIAPSRFVTDRDPRTGSAPARVEAGVSIGKDIWASRLVWDRDFQVSDLAMTSHSNGFFYVAHEAFVNGDPSDDQYIEIVKSANGGLTWQSAGWCWVVGKDLTNPSIAVTGTKIVVAYEVHETGNDPYIEVATADLTNGALAFTAYSINHYAVDNEREPHIWTDMGCLGSANGWVYLVCEQVFDAPTNNINVLFQYSAGTNGTTWTEHETLYGNTNGNEYRHPHGVVGRPASGTNMTYATAYDNTNNTIVLLRSSDWGATWLAQQNVNTLTTEPVADLCWPTVSAANYTLAGRGVIVFNTGVAANDDRIDYLLTTDDGASWIGPYNYWDSTSNEERPVVVADHLGQNFGIAFNDGSAIMEVHRPQDLSTLFSAPSQVNRGGNPCVVWTDKGVDTDWNFGFPAIVWIDGDGGAYDPDSDHQPFFNRLVPDDLVGTWDGQGVYFRTDSNAWVYLASPANLVAAGDLDSWGNGTPDLVGDWTGSGLYARNASGGAWTYIGTSPVDLAVGDMDGGGYEEILATWNGQGVYYKSSIGGGWVNMATPATMVAAGDLDGDSVDDLIGVWPAQAGVYVKYSTTGTWAYIGSAPRHITSGDMDGDGRDDLVGTWDGQGVYWRKSQTGAWTFLGTPATLVTAGDFDGDGKDDLAGIWPAQAGVWVKYSSTSEWEYIGSSLRDMSTAPMRAGPTTWGAQSAGEILFEPKGGKTANGHPIASEDLSANSPGQPEFKCVTQANLVPVHDPNIPLVPGPGMAGFTFARTPNPVPVASPKHGGDGQGKIK
jgi:hypothetical protein